MFSIGDLTSGSLLSKEEKNAGVVVERIVTGTSTIALFTYTIDENKFAAGTEMFKSFSSQDSEDIRVSKNSVAAVHVKDVASAVIASMLSTVEHTMDLMSTVSDVQMFNRTIPTAPRLDLLMFVCHAITRRMSRVRPSPVFYLNFVRTNTKHDVDGKEVDGFYIRFHISTGDENSKEIDLCYK